MFLLENALLIAADFHDGQVDRAGVAYINHIYHVVNNVRNMGGCDEAMVVAALHDIIEDTDFLEEDLRMVFGDEIADAVMLLTKNGEPIDVYYNNIKNNELARIVKIADMNHNKDLNRLPVVNQIDIERAQKYEFYIDFLEN
ncbi:MAG: HD domain-containing protein [Culicoidibacterales bacterium]